MREKNRRRKLVLRRKALFVFFGILGGYLTHYAGLVPVIVL